ncbi:MAG: hypothetical protein JW797_14005 [Bradymonadales bacterium]|nr:hypothetical protein [Bradymonadales bacterium]
MRFTSHLRTTLTGLLLVGSLAGIGCQDEPRQPPQAIEPPGSTQTAVEFAQPPGTTERQETPSSAAEAELSEDAQRVAALLAESIASSRQPQILAIDNLLNRSDLREITGFTGVLNVQPLEGQQPDEGYNAQRISPPDQFGAGLQVWELRGAAETSRHYNRLRETYVGAEEKSGNIGDRFFRADFAGIRQLVFMSRRHNRVIALSCDDTLCTQDQAIERLAELVASRL